jgi:hypothetical protein
MSLFHRLLVGGLMTLGLVIGGGITVSAVWVEPVGAPPSNNVKAPLNQDTKFGSSTAAFPLSGTFQAPNSINFSLPSCPTGQTYLSNGTAWACGAAGGSQDLLGVLNAGANASAFTGNDVRIGNSNADTSLIVTTRGNSAVWATSYSGTGTNIGIIGAYQFAGVLGAATDTTTWSGYFTGGKGVFINSQIQFSNRNKGTNDGGNYILTTNDNADLAIMAQDSLYLVIDEEPDITGGDLLVTKNATSPNSPLLIVKNNGNVGIGAVLPTAKLEVAGQIKITGGAPGAGKVLTSDAAGLATWQAPVGGGATYTAGTNIAINAVNNQISVFDNPIFSGTVTANILKANDSTHVGRYLKFTNSINSRSFDTYFIAPWEGQTSNILYVLPSTQGAPNSVLTNNGTGSLSWTVPAAGGGPWTRTGTNIHPTDLNDNVGIGTTDPIAKLDVAYTGSGAGLNVIGTGAGQVYVGNTTAGSGLAQIMFGVPGNTAANASQWHVGTWADNSGRFFVHDYKAQPQNGQYGSGQTRIMIDRSGNVGLGHVGLPSGTTFQPINARLEIKKTEDSALTPALENARPAVTVRITETNQQKNPELQLKYGTGANAHWGMYVQNSDDSFNIWGGGSNRVTIRRDNGNVGIGGNPNSNYKLSVSGSSSGIIATAPAIAIRGALTNDRVAGTLGYQSSNETEGYAVYGVTNGSNTTDYAAYFESVGGRGVYAKGREYALKAENANNPGVIGYLARDFISGVYAGVWGSAKGSQYGVVGTSVDGVGVLGNSTNGWAGYFVGGGKGVYIAESLLVGSSTATTPTQKIEVNGGIRLRTTAAKPSCTSSSNARGTMWFTQGAAGFPDSFEVCAKDAAGAYGWRALY